MIKKSRDKSFWRDLFGKKRKELIITVSGGSVIRGDIINEDEEKEVILEIGSGGKVEGKLVNVKKEKQK